MQDKRKTLIIGGVAGGASCAARLRRLDAEREIVGELLNVWNFCGDEAEFWREKRWQYKIADGQQLAIVTTAEKQWKAYQKQQN